MNAWKLVGLGVIFLTIYTDIIYAQQEDGGKSQEVNPQMEQPSTDQKSAQDQTKEQEQSRGADSEAIAESEKIPDKHQGNLPEERSSDQTVVPIEDQDADAQKKPRELAYPESEAELKENTEERTPISIGALIGYGFSLGSGDLNPFGFGFGINGGYTLEFGLYLGGRFQVYLGESDEVSGNLASASQFIIYLDIGYDLNVPPFLIRPFLGVGVAVHSGSDVMYNQPFDNDSSYFSLSPGVSLRYIPIRHLFVGGNIALDFILPDEAAGLNLMATLGTNL